MFKTVPSACFIRIFYDDDDCFIYPYRLMLFASSVNIYTKLPPPPPPPIRLRASQDSAMLVCSSPVKSRNVLTRDLLDTFAVHYGLVRDVTDTDCWAQDELENSTFSKQDEASSENLLCGRFFSFLSCFFGLVSLLVWTG